MSPFDPVPAYPPPPPPGRRLTPMPDGLRYHRLHLAGRLGGWRPVVGVLLMLGTLLVGIGIVAILPFVFWYVATGADLQSSLKTLLDTENPTPAGLAYINLALALLIPAAIAVNWLLHGLTPGWLASVARAFRWRLLLACLGAAVIALGATLVVSGIVDAVAPSQASDLGSHLNPFTATTAWYLLVILLLTPLQAAGEEYCFRGYLTQAFGAGASRWSTYAAVLVPALLFGLAHGIGQSPPVFFDRFAFGVIAGILVIRTGGLEAGIAMHVLNNFLAFGLALAFGDMASTLNPGEGSWWSIPVTLTQSLVYLALATWVCRRLGAWTTTGGGVLEAPSSRV
jgi:uncharacterized protein